MKAIKQGVKHSGIAKFLCKTKKNTSASVENKHWVASQLLSMLMIFIDYYFIHGEILAHFHTYLICIYTAFKF